MARRRGGAVVVNYLADAGGLESGTKKANRALRSVGKGANFGQLSKQIGTMTGRTGGLIASVGMLRSGWFGVGAAVTGAMAVIQRVGSEWDEAMVSIQRATGVVVSEVDGIESAFQSLAGSVPETAQEAAAAFSHAYTTVFQEIRSQQRDFNAGSLADTEVLAGQLLSLQSNFGVAPDAGARVLSQHAAGPAQRAEIPDIYAWVSQQLPGVQVEKFVDEASKIAGQIGMELADAAVFLSSIYEQTGGELTIALQVARSMTERAAKSDEPADEFLRRVFDEARVAGEAAGYTPDAQRVGAREVLAGTFGQTGDVNAIANALFPEQPDQQRLTLDPAELAAVRQSMVGAAARADTLTAQDTWAATINNLEVTLGPGARAIITGLADAADTTSRVFDERGGAGGWDVAIEIGDWLNRNVLGNVLRFPTGNAFGNLLGGLNTYTEFNRQQDLKLVEAAVKQLAIGGDGRDPLDLNRVGGAERRRLMNDIGEFGLSLFRRDSMGERLDEIERTDGQEAMVAVLATELADKFGDRIGAAINYQLHLEENPVEVTDDLLTAMREDAALREHAGKLFHDQVVTAGASLADAGAAAGHGIYAGSAAAADIMKKATQRIIWAAVDAGSLLGVDSPRIDTSAIHLNDAIEWGPIQDLAGAASMAAQSLYELNDGMMVLADGVIFEAGRVTSQTVDGNGIVTNTVTMPTLAPPAVSSQSTGGGGGATRPTNVNRAVNQVWASGVVT